MLSLKAEQYISVEYFYSKLHYPLLTPYIVSIRLADSKEK